VDREDLGTCEGPRCDDRAIVVLVLGCITLHDGEVRLCALDAIALRQLLARRKMNCRLCGEIAFELRAAR
jgi:hypothetical protein